jgi:hypothetical protein
MLTSKPGPVGQVGDVGFTVDQICLGFQVSDRPQAAEATSMIKNETNEHPTSNIERPTSNID